MDAEAQRWKEEYRSLLREQETQASEATQAQRLLRDLLRQALAACRGWQPAIDEEIEVLQVKLDQAADSQSLHALTDLAEKVARLIRSQRQSDEATTSIATNQLQQVFDHMAAELRDYPLLDKPIAAICSRTGLDTGAQFSAITKVILEVCNRLERERRDTETFLSELQQSLTHFETWTSDAASQGDAQRAASTALQQQVTEDVNAFAEAVDDGQSIAEMKSAMLARLRLIGERIASFRHAEDTRLQQVEARNAALSSELVALRQRSDQLGAQLQEQEALLLLDALTQVHSRFAYDQRLEEMLARYARQNEPFCFALWDIDHFKNVNDTLGHQGGDALLIQIASHLQRYTRSSDFVARLGGEEFVVLLPATPLEDAMQIADKLRALIAAASFEYNGESCAVSISCGVAEVRHDDTDQTLYQRADKALYEAKGAGRNRCIAA